MPYEAIFRDCAKVIQAGFSKADGYKLNEEETRAIDQAEQTTFDFIALMCKERHSATERQFIERMCAALRDLHARTDYSLRGTVIRELADFLITLERLKQGRRRTDGKKYVDAQNLCTFLMDELKAPRRKR